MLRRRVPGALAALLLCVAVPASVAGAETLTVAAGGDPAAGLPNGIDYEYDTAGVQLGLQIRARPASGPPCQPTSVMDNNAVGEAGGATPVTAAPTQVTGTGLGRVPFTFAAPGRVRICAWLYRTPDDVVVAASNEADVRAAATSLTVTAQESGASAGGADLVAHVTGTTETAADVLALVVPATLSCPATYDEDTAPAALDVQPAGTATHVTGAFDLTFRTRDRLTSFGRWRACAYVQNGAFADAATASANAVIDFALKPALLRRPKVRRAKGALTCDGGAFKAKPAARITYAWLRGGARIPGATTRRLKVTAKLRGKSVACRVTARNRLGATSATSRSVTAR